MTFNNWKELNIGGYDLKKLIRVSDGLVLFEKKSEPTFKGLCFTAEEDNSTIYLIQYGQPDALTLQTSYDGTTWSDFGRYDIINLTQGQKIYVRNKNTITQIGKSTSAYWKFGMTGKIAASGNINSLLTPNFDSDDVTLGSYCYTHLFDGCTSLTTAPNLPAKIMGSGCYQSMFYGCTSLTQAPVLPATTLTNTCYQNMFSGCISLTEAPVLPASTLAAGCYQNMFRECTALTQAPALPATELGQSCYTNMFRGCISLTEAPALPATVLRLSCYSNMFNGCTALTRVPKIAASTSYATGCMTGMLNGCSSLAYIEVDMTKWPATSQMTNWVAGVGKVGTFKCPQALPEQFATNRIPVGWTVERK